MKATQLAEALFFYADRAVRGLSGTATHTKSSPGLGKTQIHLQVAARIRKQHDIAFPVVVQHLATADATDFKGLPFAEVSPDGDRVVAWHRQPWLTIKQPFMLFLDEYSQGAPMVKNATAPLLLDHTIDGVSLPKGSWVCAASNRAEDKAAVTKDPSHIPNRLTTLTLDFDVEDFRRHMLAKGKAMEFIAFSNFRPGSINDFDPAREINATPRQWEFVADEFEALPKEIRPTCIAGRVGQGRADEFEAFLRICSEMPNPDHCIMDPTGAPVPAGGAAQYAISGALSHKASTSNLDRVIQYMDRLPAEFGVMAVKDAVVRTGGDLCNCAAFVDYSLKHQEVLL